MKRANSYKQNTKQWYAWRNKGIGASNAPTIMGNSPWCTRFQLWAEMTGLLERPEPNQYQLAAMERGKKLEPVARDLYRDWCGDVVVEADVNCEHPVYEFLRCSLDGWAELFKRVVEIKCGNKEDHKAALLKGKIPEKYVDQLMMQCLVTGAEECHYVSYYPGYDSQDPVTDLVVVVYKWDKLDLATLLVELTTFWYLVQDKQPPAIEPNDFTNVIEQIAKMQEKLGKLVKGLQTMQEYGESLKAVSRVSEYEAITVDTDGFTKVS